MRLIREDRSAIDIPGTDAFAVRCTTSDVPPPGEEKEGYIAVFLDSDAEDDDAILFPGDRMPTYNQLHTVVWRAVSARGKLRANGRQKAMSEISDLLHELTGINKVCARLSGIEQELEVIRERLP